ncbi:DUF443 family protein [Pseudogracilibacillus sp. ICA-222130]|uniref:DUF443 family protein n=1 Tax=Pseudogracilibacillus sp. ICA-222130 TaxID=3134655 RepID=UPI0030BA658C
MKVEIHNVFKNMRYNYFEVDGVYYILETQPSIWKYLFPFLYWLFPFPVYKVEDEKVIERISIPESSSVNKSSLMWSIGGIVVVIPTLLRGKIDNLILSMPLTVKIITFVITIGIVVLIRLYVTRAKQRDLQNKVDITKLEKLYIEVKPQSFKHVFQMIFSYAFLMFLMALFYVTYFLMENIFLLLMANILLFGLTFSSNIVVKEGLTTVKFINK